MLRENWFISNIKLVIIIPAHNHPKAIESLLKYSASKCYSLNIDMIIFDSSGNDKIENIVYNYTLEGFTNVKYIRYTDNTKKDSINYKINDALALCCNDYDYIWLCQERFVINIYECFNYLLKCFKKKPDYIVVDSKIRCDTNDDYIKEYTCPLTFCKEQFQRMTIMGTVIIKGNVVRDMLKKYPLNDSNCLLWLCSIIFKDITTRRFLAVFLCTDVFLNNNTLVTDEFWDESIDTLKKWDYYYHIVMNLPDSYNEIKNVLYKIDIYNFHSSRFLTLLKIRENHGITFSLINKYRMCLKEINKNSFWKIYFVAIVPICIARYLLAHKNDAIIRNLIEFYRLCVQDIDFDIDFKE